MKRGRTRFMPVLAVIVSLVVLFAACGTASPNTSTQSSATSTATGASSQAETTAPAATASSDDGLMTKYDSPTDITMVASTTSSQTDEMTKNGESYDNNRWTKLYKDKLNINIKYLWEANAGDAYNAKFNVMLASGDLPDILTVTNIQFKQLLDANQLADLTNLFPEMDKMYLDAANQDPYMMKQSTFDGKIMGIPQSSTSPYGADNVMWFRSDWMKKLNLAAPKTMDDVINIAKAFKSANLDKQTGVYGLGLDKALDQFSLFANAYHAYPNTWLTDSSTGQLVNGNIQPEMKTALEKLAGMYQSGLIEKEFGTKDLAAVGQDLTAGKVGIEFEPLYFPLEIANFKTGKPGADFTSYPIVSADSAPAKVSSKATVSQWFVVSSKCKNPDALIKISNLNNAMLSGDLANLPGPEGLKNSEYYGAGKSWPTAYSYVQVWYTMISDQNIQRLYINDAVNKKDPSTVSANDMPIYTNMLAYMNGDNSQWAWYRVFNNTDGGSNSVGYYKKNNLGMIDAYLGLPTQTMLDKQATLDQLQVEMFTKIIMGAAPISDFDKYVTQWRNLGGDDMTKEVNDWYSKNK